jgi:hypothetical protein
MERQIHAHFGNVRKYGKKKEFFTITSDVVVAHFQTLTFTAMRALSDAENATIQKKLHRIYKSKEGPSTVQHAADAPAMGQTEKLQSSEKMTPSASTSATNVGSEPECCLVDSIKCITAFVDKFPVLKESLTELMESKRQMLVLDQAAAEVEINRKTRTLELDQKAVDIKRTAAEIDIDRKTRMLELYKQELEIKASHEERMSKINGRKRKTPQNDPADIEF